MTESEQTLMWKLQAENSILKERVSGICKVYFVLRPILKFAKVFAFIKKGGKVAIDAAIAVLDEACKYDNQ